MKCVVVDRLDLRAGCAPRPVSGILALDLSRSRGVHLCKRSSRSSPVQEKLAGFTCAREARGFIPLKQCNNLTCTITVCTCSPGPATQLHTVYAAKHPCSAQPMRQRV
eukprot:350905-Chlamydomonas_euryale.AAC.7